MYACCTLPAYRGKGFMSVLIEESFQLATERGIEFLVLVPAEPSLYDYYSKFGFETKFYKKSAVLSRDYLAAFSKKADLTGAFNLDVFDVRQTALGLSDFLNWGTDIIKYAMFENAYTKGALAAASDGYALYTIGKDTMYIKEIMTVGDIGELFYVLLLEEDVDKFVINLPVSSPWHFEGETVSPAGMCAPVIDSAQPAFAEIKDAYIGITLG
jgi:predicted acetyltransferase